jgi:hypothetical protein
MSNLPLFYGLSIVLFYGFLLAEFVSAINDIFMQKASLLGTVYDFFMKASYYITILSSIAVWLITSLLFHLTALLFNGTSSFNRFIRLSSYPYIIPAIVMLISIFLLDSIQIMEGNIAELLPQDKQFRFIFLFINWSFFPYYLSLIVLIRYSYNIKWLYSSFSVIIPVISIWIITELFKLL